MCSATATPQKVYNLVTFKSIWKSKSERLKRNVLIKDYEKGGLKIPDFNTAVKSTNKMDKKDKRKSYLLLETNFKELFRKVECRYAIFVLHKVFDEISWTDPPPKKKKTNQKNLPSSYLDIIKLLSEVGHTTDRGKRDFIWYNKDINTKDSALVDTQFLQAGIWYTDDLYKENREVTPFEH